MTKHFDGETGAPIAADMVNHPPHYAGSRWESIEIIERLGNQFRLGNALKYIFRHEKKGGVQDLKKARWYLEREMAAERMASALRGGFDLRFYEENARFFATSFGITDENLTNCVACISGAHLNFWNQDEPAWRGYVREAIGHLNAHILGLGGEQ